MVEGAQVAEIGVPGDAGTAGGPEVRDAGIAEEQGSTGPGGGRPSQEARAGGTEQGGAFHGGRERGFRLHRVSGWGGEGRVGTGTRNSGSAQAADLRGQHAVLGGTRSDGAEAEVVRLVDGEILAVQLADLEGALAETDDRREADAAGLGDEEEVFPADLEVRGLKGEMRMAPPTAGTFFGWPTAANSATRLGWPARPSETSIR